MEAQMIGKYLTVLNQTFYKKLGKVENVVGLTIESTGPDAKLGDLCRIYTDAKKQQYILTICRCFFCLEKII